MRQPMIKVRQVVAGWGSILIIILIIVIIVIVSLIILILIILIILLLLIIIILIISSSRHQGACGRKIRAPRPELCAQTGPRSPAPRPQLP